MSNFSFNVLKNDDIYIIEKYIGKTPVFCKGYENNLTINEVYETGDVVDIFFNPFALIRHYFVKKIDPIPYVEVKDRDSFIKYVDCYRDYCMCLPLTNVKFDGEYVCTFNVSSIKDGTIHSFHILEHHNHYTGEYYLSIPKLSKDFLYRRDSCLLINWVLQQQYPLLDHEYTDSIGNKIELIEDIIYEEYTT